MSVLFFDLIEIVNKLPSCAVIEVLTAASLVVLGRLPNYRYKVELPIQLTRWQTDYLIIS